jgi:hemolysin D
MSYKIKTNAMLFKNKQTEHEFLPATLEIQESPPSPLGRLITWLIILFFVVALVWALIGKVDIVVSAPGKIITRGHTKVIQPLNTGIIQTIYVHEGQKVKQGDILVELKPDSAIADQKRIDDELVTLEQDKTRLKIAINWIKQNKSDLKSTPKSLTALQRQLLLAQWQQYQSQLSTLKQEQNKYRSEQDSIEQQVQKYQAILPILTQRASKLKMLSDKQFLQEDQYLEIE